MQVKSQEARGNKEVVETPWLPLETALTGVDMQPVAQLNSGIAASGGGGGSSSTSKGKPGDSTAAGIPPQGSVRRVGFSAAGMGMKVRTCVNVLPGPCDPPKRNHAMPFGILLCHGWFAACAAQGGLSACLDAAAICQCHAYAMVQYKTEELQRLLVAKPGQFYTLEGCVSTTATYGDTFRVITRTRWAVLKLTRICRLLCSAFFF